MVPVDHVKCFRAVHSTAIEGSASTIVVLNGGRERPGAHGGTCHGLVAILEFIHTEFVTFKEQNNPIKQF